MKATVKAAILCTQQVVGAHSGSVRLASQPISLRSNIGSKEQNIFMEPQFLHLHTLTFNPCYEKSTICNSIIRLKLASSVR
jgi:hypothetical protein